MEKYNTEYSILSWRDQGSLDSGSCSKNLQVFYSECKIFHKTQLRQTLRQFLIPN